MMTTGNLPVVISRAGLLKDNIILHESRFPLDAPGRWVKCDCLVNVDSYLKTGQRIREKLVE